EQLDRGQITQGGFTQLGSGGGFHDSTQPATTDNFDAANTMSGREPGSPATYAGPVTVPFRCSAAASLAGEPMAGTAPDDASYLLVEYAGAWGRKALAESRLPEEVRDRLGNLDARVLLIRRHGGLSGPGVRIFTVQVTADGCTIETGLLREA